jgi:hypothetical protein
MAGRLERDRRKATDPHRALLVTAVVLGHTDHKVVSLGFLSVEDYNRCIAHAWSIVMERPFVVSLRKGWNLEVSVGLSIDRFLSIVPNSKSRPS